MSLNGEHSDEDVLELIGVNENQGSDNESGGEQQEEPNPVQENADDEDAVKKRVDPNVPKRTRSAIPRLTTELLKGPKGVHTIEKYFDGFKLYGKGREKEDLDRIMKRLEHWAYRLFPKLNFDDCLAKIENLGNKKDLQVSLKKYRLGMMTEDEDLIRPDLIADADDDNQENSAPREEFDLLLAEQIEKQRQKNTVGDTNAFDNLFSSTITQNEPRYSNLGLNDEVKQRIERNRQIALEKKQATMKRLKETPMQQETQDSQDLGITNCDNVNLKNISLRDADKDQRLFPQIGYPKEPGVAVSGVEIDEIDSERLEV